MCLLIHENAPLYLLLCLWIAGNDSCFALSKIVSMTRCSVSLFFALLNASNLLLQLGHVLLQFLHVPFQRVLVLFKHETTLGQSSGTLPAQLGKAHHLCARHACIPQSDEQVDPGKIVLRIATMAVLRPPDWRKQPDALIVAQGIDAQPRLLSNLLDSKSCFHATSI